MLRWVISVAVLLAFAAAPASADVDAYATIYKTKDITVTEEINITKNVDIDVRVDVEPESVAEAFALLNQTNVHNHACTACELRSREKLCAFRRSQEEPIVGRGTGTFESSSVPSVDRTRRGLPYVPNWVFRMRSKSCSMNEKSRIW